MIKNKNKAFFLFLLVLSFSFAVSHVSGQDSYNPFTLMYFRQSLESLVIGDFDAAIENSSLVIRRDPNSSVAYTIRARAHYEKGNMTNAIADCTQAIRFDRNNISAFSIRGSAYAKTGDFNRAIADWEAVLRLNPDSTDARQNIELAQQRRAVR